MAGRGAEGGRPRRTPARVGRGRWPLGALAALGALALAAGRGAPLAPPRGEAFVAPAGAGRRQLLARGLGLLVAGAAGGEAARAVSGGGKDYAGLKLTTSFKGGDYSGKDFSGCSAQSVDFTKSAFRGNRFFKANLEGADFSGSDLSGASLEGADLSDVVFDGAVLDGAYFTENIATVKSMKGATFNDALVPTKVLGQLCRRADVQASEATKESLMCP